jgi:hypothetical protein
VLAVGACAGALFALHRNEALLPLVEKLKLDQVESRLNGFFERAASAEAPRVVANVAQSDRAKPDRRSAPASEAPTSPKAAATQNQEHATAEGIAIVSLDALPTQDEAGPAPTLQAKGQAPSSPALAPESASAKAKLAIQTSAGSPRAAAIDSASQEPRAAIGGSTLQKAKPAAAVSESPLQKAKPAAAVSESASGSAKPKLAQRAVTPATPAAPVGPAAPAPVAPKANENPLKAAIRSAIEKEQAQ